MCRVVLRCVTMSHISVRLDADLEEQLDRYAERHHLENRSQALRHALRSILNLEEGESVILKPATKRPTKSAGSMKSKASKRVVKKGAPLTVVPDDLEEARKILDRVQNARSSREVLRATKGDPEAEPQTEAEYFEAVRRENEQKARGVGPEPW